MKLEFLVDISNRGKFSQAVSERLIRLYDFDSLQALRLKNAIETDLVKKGNAVDLASLDFVEPLNGFTKLTVLLIYSFLREVHGDQPIAGALSSTSVT